MESKTAFDDDPKRSTDVNMPLFWSVEDIVADLEELNYEFLFHGAFEDYKYLYPSGIFYPGVRYLLNDCERPGRQLLLRYFGSLMKDQTEGKNNTHTQR